MHTRGKLHYGINSGAPLSKRNSRYSDQVDTQPTAEIYIDFEGNKDNPPTLLGVLERTKDGEIFRQIILEDVFEILAPSERHPQLRVDSLANVLSHVDNQLGFGCICR